MTTQMELCATRSGLLAKGRRNLRSISALLILLLLLLGSSMHAHAQADASAATINSPATEVALLKLKPGRCVALHQGQVCYQRVQLEWRAALAGHYCLYQKSADQPLHCWQNVSAGEYVYAFASDTSVQLQLLDAQTQALIAQAELEVAWVYKANTRRKTQWRLF